MHAERLCVTQSGLCQESFFKKGCFVFDTDFARFAPLVLRRQLPCPNFLEKFMAVRPWVSPPSFFANGLSQSVEFFLSFRNNTDALPKGRPTASASIGRKAEIISFASPLRSFGLGPAGANNAVFF